MYLLWGNIVAALVTLIVGVTTVFSSNRAHKDSNSIAVRTVSLDEMEKALTWTGAQLSDLRAEVLRQHDEIRELQAQYADCEREKRRLDREIGELRNGGRRHA